MLKVTLKEGLSGSFDAIRDKLINAIRQHPSFPEKKNGVDMWAYVEDINADVVIVKYDGLQYAMGYSIVDDLVVLGEPKKVEERYVITETITDRKRSKSEDILDFISLQEAAISDDGSKVKVVLIECGTNKDKKRHYPEQTIKEAAGHFAGLKMYLNHPTPQEEAQRPERDLRDWVATISESYYESGKAIGVVAVHDVWLRERLKDPIARQQVGLSINTGGKVAMGKINGEDYQIVEKIVFKRKNGPVSVDWVTEAGARGRVLELLESERKEAHMLETVTLVELKEARKDLVEAIGKEANAELQKRLDAAEAQLKEASTKLVEAQGVIKAADDAKKLADQVGEVDTLLKEAKIPEASKAKVREGFTKSIVENIKEAVGAAIKSELEYINKLTETGKIKMGGSDDKSTSLKESLQKGLDERAGVAEKKKE